MSSKPEASESHENSEGGAPKKKVAGKRIVLIVAAVALLLGGGAGAYFSGMIGGKKADHAEHEDADSHGEKPAAHAKPAAEETGKPAYFDVPAMVVNLTSTSRKPVYAKVRINLVLAKEEQRPDITNNMPRINDSIQTYMRELTIDELQGSAGLIRLREELLIRINAAVAPAVVRDVLFQEILPQ